PAALPSIAAAAAAAIEGSAAGVVFIARTPDRARRLVADMRLLASIDDVEIVDAADDVSEAITRVEILINTTPVGLTDPDATPLEPKALHAQLAVLDAIYRPASTRLLRDALAAGAIAIPGTRMFLAQAAAQIRAFAARDAPMDAMREALMAIPGCEWV
ncbi:hypothetical protein K8I61_19870, partial [bacterium]|nr:hypothetical protein [bacterium]